MGVFDIFKSRKVEDIVDKRTMADMSFPILSLDSKTGVQVSPKTALNYSTVFACVDLIASTIAQLKPTIYERKNGGRYPVDDHDQTYIIAEEPHSQMSRYQWARMMVVYYELWGDAISLIKLDNKGRPKSYVVQMPWDVKIEKEELPDGDYRLWYKIKDKTYRQDEVIHWSDMSIDGKRGAGKISSNKESIGLGIALRDYGNELIGNGGKIMGYLHGEKRMTPEAYKLLARNFINGYGSDNGVGILPHGWKYEQFKYPLPAADAQYIEAKNFTRDEICTIFRTPPFLIGLSGDINNSVAENLIRTWLMTVIAPMCTMIEGEWNRKIFLEKDKGKKYVKYNVWQLDRADIERTANALSTFVNNGLMTINEARGKIESNPIDGGDKLRVPLNMASLDVAEDYFLSQIAKNGEG